MDGINKTLYIPLFGKAYVSSRGILLSDRKAEQIWNAEGFALKGKARSKWLAYYMGMRCAVFDRWVRQRLEEAPEQVVLHLGCGLDSRVLRLENSRAAWFDVDLPEVIAERKRHFRETENYRMIPADVRDCAWLEEIPRGGRATVIMEGISMYLEREALCRLFEGLKKHFDRVELLMDCYSEFAAKASKYKNPVHTVGVTRLYGIDDPRTVAVLPFVREHSITPAELIGCLPPGEQGIFRRIYAGKLARSLYRLYEYGWERKTGEPEKGESL